MDPKIQRLSDLFRRRIAAEDDLRTIDEQIASLLASKSSPTSTPRKPANKPKPTKTGKPGLNGKWSKKYDECQDCHSTGNPHRSGGLCTKCYSAWLSSQTAKKRKAVKWGKSKYSRTGQPASSANAPDHYLDTSAAYTYKCDCGAEFKSVWDCDMGDSVCCPKCNAKMTRANKF
jgi:hypothetical protein